MKSNAISFVAELSQASSSTPVTRAPAGNRTGASKNVEVPAVRDR
jgi:hypothetical protein